MALGRLPTGTDRDGRRADAGPGRLMAATSLLIVVVDDVLDRAQKLKALIEFMDVPQVQVATPESWRSDVGERRLAAVFLSNDLERHRMHEVIAGVGECDPNVPIVVVNNSRDIDCG